MIKLTKRSKILLAIFTVVIIAALTVAGLKLYDNQNKKTTTPSAVKTDTKPKIENAIKLIEAYKKTTDIKDRGSLYSEIDTTPGNSAIYYSNSSRKYSTAVTATALVQYKLSDEKGTANTAGIISSTEAFLANLDVKKGTSATLDPVTRTLFDGPTVVCQTESWGKFNSQPATFGLSCIDVKQIDSIYKTIDSQLQLAKTDVNASNVKSALATSITDKDKQLDVISIVNSDKSSQTIYFTVANSKSTYIGTRPTPMVDVKDSFNIPAKLQTAINSSADKVFLLKYIK